MKYKFLSPADKKEAIRLYSKESIPVIEIAYALRVTPDVIERMLKDELIRVMRANGESLELIKRRLKAEGLLL